MAKSWSIILSVCLMAGILAGCKEESSPEEQVQNALEKSVQKEKTFEEQQTPLAELENKEKEIYDEIIGLGMKEFDKIAELSDQALENLEKRKKLIEKENDSIQQSREEFEKAADPLSQIEDQKLKKEAAQLQIIMKNRYNAYDELYEAYKESLENDETLYNLFKKEDLKMDELETQINQINASYERVQKANDSFNKQTEKFNQQKKTFYKDTEMD